MESYWEQIGPELRKAAVEYLPKGEIVAPRQRVAMVFGVRAFRRSLALEQLFASGLCSESYPVVRADYEDWLTVAYLLRLPGADRCDEYFEDVYKLDARMYDAFVSLSGQAAADKYFGPVDPDAEAHVGLPRGQTRPFGGMTWANIALDVGLKSVHDFAYTWLSAQSHGSFKNMLDLFDPTIGKVRVPERDLSFEVKVGIWAAWFEARIHALGAREFWVDGECLA